MGEGRISQEWDHTSALLAMLVNVHSTSKTAEIVVPSDYHPYMFEEKKRLESFGEIRHLFPEDRKK